MGAKPRARARKTVEGSELVQGQAHAALSYVLSKILNRNEESIRNDSDEYAAYHWDDGFLEQYGDAIDWATGEFEGVDSLEYPFWARADFDTSRSIVYDESVDPGVLGEGPLKGLAEERRGHFYLPELAQVVASGHAEIQYPMFFGKIASGASLLEAASHLFVLHHPPRTDLTEEYAEVDEDWSDMLAEIGDADLRHHFSLFFQTAFAARSFGATFVGKCDDAWKDVKQIEAVACWTIGEGQGGFCLARVLRPSTDELLELGAPQTKEAQSAPGWDGGELFQLAINTSQPVLARLDALEKLLDRFDELLDDHQNRVLTVLGNPWTTEPKRALEVLGKAVAPCLKRKPDFVHMLYFQSGFAADRAGDQERSIELYTRAIATKPDALDGMYYYNRACEYGFLGRAAEAVADLSQAVAFSSSWAARAANSGHMARVRDDPRFQAILAEHG